MLSRGPGVRVLVAGGLVLAVLGTGAPAGADEAGGRAPADPVEQAEFCSAVADTEEPIANPEPSSPLEQMRIEDIHDRYTRGGGVGVAVIDSGVAPTPYYDVAGGLEVVTAPGPLEVEHGTVVAGLIAGRDRPGGLGMGVAPEARLFSLRVVGSDESDDEGIDVDGDFDPADVVEALRWVSDNAGREGIRVVNMSLTTDPSEELAAAVREVQRAGVLVVAATGNRDPEEAPEADRTEPLDGPFETYPASLPGVVGVSAYVPVGTEGGSAQWLLNTTNVDVAVPVVGGASVVPNGSTCVVDAIATSWAAPYVSGILALLADHFGDDNNRQLVQRLVETASGSGDQRATYTGFGVVQPLEAFTRELTPARGDGDLGFAEQADDRGGAAPEPPLRADALEESREDFRWWGLLAGAVLVAAVILRPLMRRVGRR